MSYETELAAWGKNADEKVNDLYNQVEAIGYKLVAAEQELLNKNAQIEVLIDEVDRLNRVVLSNNIIINRLRDTRARLKAELAECKGTVVEPPPLSEPPSLFGSSTGKHTYDYFKTMAGVGPEVRRTYDTWPAAHPREDAGRNASVWSFKPPVEPFLSGALNNEFKAAISSIPDDDYRRFVILWHEPEDNIEDGDFTAAQYQALQVKARGLIDEVNATRKKKVRFGANWMSWTFVSASRRTPDDYWPGDGVWDFLSFDGYSSRNDKTQTWTGGRTPEAIFGPPFAYAKSKGIRPGVGETGIDVLAPEPDRVAWIKDCRQYAADANCEFWCYWDGSFSTFWLNTEAEFKAVVLD